MKKQLQDDVHFDEFAETFEMVPPNYSILQLGSCLHSWKKQIGEKRKMTPNLGDADHCTAAYAISKQGAILMFKSLPVSHPIDHLMVSGWGGMHHPDFATYSVWPSLIKPSHEVNERSKTGIRDRKK